METNEQCGASITRTATEQHESGVEGERAVEHVLGRKAEERQEDDLESCLFLP